MKTYVKSIYTCLICSFLIINGLLGQGEPKWRWAHFGSDATVELSITDTLGNTYVFGKFSSSEFTLGTLRVAGSAASESNNLFLAKYSSTGTVLWLKGISGTDINTILKPVKIEVNDRGEVAILGTATNTLSIKLDNSVLSFTNTSEQIFTAKFHRSGRMVWARIAQPKGIQNSLISANDMVLGENGEVWITGHFIADTVMFNLKALPGHPTDALFYIVKYNSIGMVDWAETCKYDTKGDNGTISGHKIAVDHSGNICLFGGYYGYRSFYLSSDTLYSEGAADLFIAKFSAFGKPLWVRNVTGKTNEIPQQLLVTGTGAIIISGFYNSANLSIAGQEVINSSAGYDLFIAKISTDGDLKWATNVDTKLLTMGFNGHKLLLNVDEVEDIYAVTLFQGAEVFSGLYRINNADAGTPDLLFFKFSGENGNPVWTKSASGIGENYLNAAAFDKFNNIYFATDLSESNLISNEILVKDTVGFGGNYIAKINRLGKTGFVKPLLNRDSANSTGVKSISLDHFGNLYVSGIFNGKDNALDSIHFGASNAGVFTAKYAYFTSISGHVKKDNGTIIANGYVKIFGFTRFQRAPVSDSVRINPDGTYLFKTMPFGRYIVYAYPQKEGYPNSIPTYYPNASYWEDAIPLTILTTAPVNNIDIVINMPAGSGTNSMGGSVFESDTVSFFKTTKSILKAPSKKVSVVLINKKKSTNEEFVAYVYTDDEGNFTITNVPDGWYTLLADVPGMPHYSTYDVYVTGGMYVGNLYYELGLDQIYATGELTYTQGFEQSSGGLTVWPNPCKQSLTIALQDGLQPGLLTLNVYSVTGQLVLSLSYDNPDERITFDISKLASGVYLMNVGYKGQNYFEKIIKQ
ncbi:MAG: T9SS type A sorting domain-containing protein [Bacteroidales bacterium]